MKKSVILFLMMLSIASFSTPVMASEKEPMSNTEIKKTGTSGKCLVKNERKYYN